MREAPMGFLADVRPARKRKVREALRKSGIDPADVLISFDSGRAITFADGRQHILVFGTTGSGKTVCVILPAALNAIRAGHAMVLGDIKGNMGDAVRKMAAACGRSADVVEYGCGPRARRINLIAWMGDDAIRRLFEKMVDDCCPAGESTIWARKGAVMAADLVILLRFMAGSGRRCPQADLATVSRLANNQFEAQKLYTEYLERIYNPREPAQRSFVESIEHNRFHLLRRLERQKGARMEQSGSDKTRDEQVTWNMQAIRMALRSFLEAPGIAEHFAALDGPGIDLDEDVMRGRIILLRFDARTGRIGQTLTRMMLAGCYSAVLRTTVGQRGGSLFFSILDELQEYADFSDSPGSEKHFAALGREFGGCLIAATQSMSSLACKTGTPLPVESFVGNCNNILSFYSHDPSTQELASRYDPRVRLNRLRPGELFAVTYDSAARKHGHGREKLDRAYRGAAKVLAGVELPPPAEPAARKDERMAALSRLTATLGAVLERKRDEEAMKLEAETQEREDEMQEIPDDVIEQLFGAAAPRESRERGHDDSGDESRAEPDGFSERIIGEFPQLFTADFGSACVPAGWRDFTVSALRMFTATGLPARISSLGLSRGRLEAEGDDGSGQSVYLLNRMLKEAEGICLICGSRICREPAREEGAPLFRDAAAGWGLPVCQGCRRKYMPGDDQGQGRRNGEAV